MRNLYVSQLKKTVAGIMALMMLVFVLFSVSYIAIEADHDCTEEDCPVCACIQQCEMILQQMGEGATLRISAVIPVILLLIAVVSSAARITRGTLVSEKVRLNN